MRINPIIVIHSKRHLVSEREMSILVEPNKYPNDQVGSGTLSLNDFEALETRRSIRDGRRIPISYREGHAARQYLNYLGKEHYR